MGKLGGFELLAQYAADEARNRVMRMRDIPYGDSPIEHLFSAALRTVARESPGRVRQIAGIRPDVSFEESWNVMKKFHHQLEIAVMKAQVQLANWRVDFLIEYMAGNSDPGCHLARLIVECDGHDFHERTGLQAKRDRSRDRLAQQDGYNVFRFTGSELWNDPMACAEEVLSFMERDA